MGFAQHPEGVGHFDRIFSWWLTDQKIGVGWSHEQKAL
jgi:hypothetical protein